MDVGRNESTTMSAFDKLKMSIGVVALQWKSAGGSTDSSHTILVIHGIPEETRAWVAASMMV